MSKTKPFFLYLLILLGFGIATSNAVTFGKEVSNASVAYPSVISIWYAESSVKQPEFLCTGTLINPRIVLTAAHCIYSTGLLYVQYGADQLDDDIKIYEVSASWRNPRFSERQLVNDVGLLLLTNPIQGALVTSLPAKSTMVNVQSNKSVKYEIVGWGDDQNGDRATYLKRAAVDDQTAKMKKLKWWRNDVWFAVGKYNSKEKVFAGSCNGDSGGPLFANLNGSSYLVGVTSWGAEDCELGAPSVYVRLSYYVDSIKTEGIPQLYVNEVKQNRALPSLVVEPKILGSAIVGGTLTCDVGSWGSNTTKITHNWSGSGVNWDGQSKTVKVSENESTYEKSYICTVIGTNANGSTKRSITLNQKPAPVVSSAPALQNMPLKAIQETTKINCTQATYSFAESVKSEIWIGYSSGSAKKLSGLDTFELDKSSFQLYGGSYIFCKSIASGQGGVTETFSQGVLVPSFTKPATGTKPVVKNIPSAALDGKIVVTCTPPTFTDATKVSFDWLIATSSYSADKLKVASGSEITLNRESFQTWGGKYLYCRTIATGIGGTTEVDSIANLIPTFVKPVIQSGSAQINGLTNYEPSFVGKVITCKGITWSKPVDSEKIKFYIDKWPDDVLISESNSLVLTQDFISKYVNYEIFCSIQGINAGGSTTSTSSSVRISAPVSGVGTDCEPHPSTGVCLNQPKLLSSRIYEGPSSKTYYHTISVKCVGDKSRIKTPTLSFGYAYAPIAFECDVATEYGGFSSYQSSVTANITVDGYRLSSAALSLSTDVPTTTSKTEPTPAPTPTPTSTPTPKKQFVPFDVKVTGVVSIPSPEDIWAWNQTFTCTYTVNILAKITASWVIYNDDSFDVNSKQTLSTTMSNFIFSNPNIVRARGKYFGCEVIATEGNNEFIDRKVFKVNENATALSPNSVAIPKQTVPLALKGTNYEITVLAGGASRVLVNVFDGKNDCLTVKICGAVALTKDGTGNWKGNIDVGRILTDKDVILIYRFDSQNMVASRGENITNWGVVLRL